MGRARCNCTLTCFVNVSLSRCALGRLLWSCIHRKASKSPKSAADGSRVQRNPPSLRSPRQRRQVVSKYPSGDAIRSRCLASITPACTCTAKTSTSGIDTWSSALPGWAAAQRSCTKAANLAQPILRHARDSGGQASDWKAHLGDARRPPWGRAWRRRGRGRSPGVWRRRRPSVSPPSTEKREQRGVRKLACRAHSAVPVPRPSQSSSRTSPTPPAEALRNVSQEVARSESFPRRGRVVRVCAGKPGLHAQAGEAAGVLPVDPLVVEHLPGAQACPQVAVPRKVERHRVT